MNPLGPGGFFGVLTGVMSIIGAVAVIAGVTALVILLARFLVIGTRAAQLYIANHAPSGPPPHPDAATARATVGRPAETGTDTDRAPAQTTAADRAPLVDDAKRPPLDATPPAAPRSTRTSPPKAAPRAAGGTVARDSADEAAPEDPRTGV